MTKKNTAEKEEKDSPAREAQDKEEKVVTLKEEDYLKIQQEISQAKEYQERLLRIQADFDNARKRIEKQNQDFIKYAAEEIILELLTILDDLERTTLAAENKSSSLETFLKGIEMILAHLYEMLKKYGVKHIEAAGRPFDPHTSEALMQVESDMPEHTVLEELQKGYYLHERIIRTAKVKVASAAVKETAQESKETKTESSNN